MEIKFISSLIKGRLLLNKIYKTESSIPILILLETLKFHFEQKDLHIKILHKSLPYSEISLRLHMRELEANNLIRLEKSLMDKRNKTLKPTKELIQKFYELKENMEKEPII